MASDNVVEYVLKINANKGKVSLKQLSGELKKSQAELVKTGNKGQRSFKKLGASALKAKAAISSLSSGLTSMGTQLSLLGAGFLYLLKSQADYVNQLVDMSARTGIAAEQLAGLKLAAEGSGASFESVERGMDRFLPKLLEVQKGTGRTADLFNELGVAVEDDVTKKMRNSGDVFNDLIKALGKMEDQQKANAIAMELFGRQAGGMLIQSGAIQSLDEFVERARELGPALDENGIRKAQEFQRGWAEVKLGIMSFVTELAEGITGEQGIGNALSALAEKLPEWGRKVGKFFEELYEYIKPIVETIKDAVDYISDPFSTKGMLTSLSLSGGGSAPLTAYEALEEYKGEGSRGLAEGVLRSIAPETYPDVEILNPVPDIQEIGDVDYDPTTPKKPTQKQIKAEQELQDLIRDRIQLLKDSLTPQQRTIFELEEQILKYEKITDTIQDGVKLTQAQALAQSNLAAVTEKRQRTINEGHAEEKKAFFDINSTALELLETMTDLESQMANNEIGAADAKKEMDRIAETISQLKSESNDLEFTWSQLLSPELAKAYDQSLSTITTGLTDSFGEISEIIDEAVAKAERLAQTQISLNIAANILEIAGGDVVGGITSLMGQLAERGTITQGAADLAGGFGTIISSLEQLGQNLVKAEDEALEKHINTLVEGQERVMGRKLTDEEIKAIENGLSSAEVERIKEDARKEMVRARIENMVKFISLAISELPIILIEVLPPMLAKLAQNITKSLFLLPGKIIESMGKAVINWFKWLGETIVNALKFWKNDDADPMDTLNLTEEEKQERKEKLREAADRMYGITGYRKGGRYLNARSGIRFTGMRDQMAQLHRNEYVVSESGAMPQGVKRIMNDRGGGGGIVINIQADVVERNAIDELVRKIERQFQNFGTSESTLFGETA